MTIVLVIHEKTNPRIKEFTTIFEGLGHEFFLATTHMGIDWFRLDSTGDWKPISKPERPVSATVLLMHGGDYEESHQAVSAQLVNGWGKAFIFNAPGDPPIIEGFIRILRPTNPFGLVKKHAKEICEFAVDTSVSAPLPSCCVHAAKHLIALDILCQGYLFAHGLLIGAPGSKSEFPTTEAWKRIELSTERTEWWLRGLGVQSLEELQAKLQEEELLPVSAEKVANKLRAALCPDATQSHLIVELRELLAELLS